jgi:hypothetical protein
MHNAGTVSDVANKTSILLIIVVLMNLTSEAGDTHEPNDKKRQRAD